MEPREIEIGPLQTSCTVEAMSPMQISVRAEGSGGEQIRVEAAAMVDLIQNTTQICYTLTNLAESTASVASFAVPICRLMSCASLDLPTFSEPAQPPGCCPSPDDALSFVTDPGPVCSAVVTFDPQILAGECLRFCLTYNAVLTLTTELFTVQTSSGEALRCSTLTVVCPQTRPTTTTTTTTTTSTTTTTTTTTTITTSSTSTSTTSSTTPPPKGLNWPVLIP